MKITGLQKGTDKWTFIYWKIITEEVKEKWKINKRILNIREEFKKLKRLYSELKELSKIIGMNNIKRDIVKLILYEIQDLENIEEMGQHICIMGGPGVGKTEVSKILAKILLKIKP